MSQALAFKQVASISQAKESQHTKPYNQIVKWISSYPDMMGKSKKWMHKKTKLLSASKAVCTGKGNALLINEPSRHDSTTLSGWFSSSPIPFLFLIFHIHKHKAERSTPVLSWKRSIQWKWDLHRDYPGSITLLSLALCIYPPHPITHLSFFAVLAATL